MIKGLSLLVGVVANDKLEPIVGVVVKNKPILSGGADKVQY